MAQNENEDSAPEPCGAYSASGTYTDSGTHTASGTYTAPATYTDSGTYTASGFRLVRWPPTRHVYGTSASRGI